MSGPQIIFPGVRRWTDLRVLGDDGEYYGPEELEEYRPRPGDIIYYGPHLQVEVPRETTDDVEVELDSIILTPPPKPKLTKKRRRVCSVRTPTKSSEKKRRKKHQPQPLLRPIWC